MRTIFVFVISATGSGRTKEIRIISGVCITPPEEISHNGNPWKEIFGMYFDRLLYFFPLMVKIICGRNLRVSVHFNPSGVFVVSEDIRLATPEDVVALANYGV